MKSDFAFCGITASSLGLQYAPELQDTYIYRPAESEVHEETFEGHNGGYIYGAWKKPKEFSLRCFFEEKQIDRGILDKIHSIFKPGKTGKLIFSRRPWCYYNATVISVDDKQITNYLNGVVTIILKAAYPFAISDIMYRERTDKYRDDMVQNTAVYERADMLLANTFENQTSAFRALLGNPGTELTPIGVYVDGDASAGIKITNITTGQEMKLTAFSKAITTDVNKKIYVDSKNGKTLLKSNSESELAFIYHESGFLYLEPGYPAKRNIYVSYVDGSVLTTKGFFPDNIVGEYIFANGSWHRIIESIDRQTISVSGRMTGSGTERTQIMKLNELYIEPIETMDINISFVFKPTYT